MFLCRHKTLLGVYVLGRRYIVLPEIMKEAIIAHLETNCNTTQGDEKLRNFLNSRRRMAKIEDVVS